MRRYWKKLIRKLLSLFGNSITAEFGHYKVKYIEGSESGTSKYGKEYSDCIGIEICTKKSGVVLAILWKYWTDNLYVKKLDDKYPMLVTGGNNEKLQEDD